MKTILIFLGLAGVAFLFMGGCSGQFTSWYTDSNRRRAHALMEQLLVRDRHLRWIEHPWTPRP